MGLFTDGFKLLKKASEPLYKTPKSIQETIEIMAVAENGIFEVSRNKYSKCYRFQDINYTTATEDEQIGIFERYCKFLNSLDCNYKITINNKNKNMEDLRDKVLITEKNDGFNNYRRIYNDIIEEKIIEGRQGIEQERYLTITIERKNFEEAKAQFATLEATIHKAFIELGAEIVPLNGNERLKVLYDYYHLGDEGSFDFDIKKAKKVGADFKNDLCNGMVKYFPDHFEDESKYCKALFIKKYPSSLSDRFINEITSLPVHSITSIDVVPVPKDLTTKVLQKKYLGIESDIIKQQRVRNKNNDFSTEISYAKRTEKKEIEAIMDDVRENDQCLFFVGVTIILTNKDEWYVFENHHIALIAKEQFYAVQKNKRKVIKPTKKQTVNMLKGKIICGCCGSSIHIHPEKHAKVYLCTHRKRYGKDSCNCLPVKVDDVYAAVLAVIKEQIQVFVDREMILKEHHNDSRVIRQEQVYTEAVNKCVKEMDRLMELKSGLYADYTEELLDEKEYLQLNREYSQRIEKLKIQADEYRQAASQYESAEKTVAQLKAEMLRFKGKRKLTQEMVDLFVAQVRIYENKNLEIVLNYEDELKKFAELNMEREAG